LSCKDAINEVARIIYAVHDEVKDKEFELELSWICPESNNQHEYVPAAVKANAEKFAKAATDESMQE